MPSCAEVFGQVIDCRQLVLRVHFYGLRADQIDALATMYYQYIHDTFASKYVLDWHFNGKAIKALDACLAKEKNRYGLFRMTLAGDFVSKIVFNKTSLRKYGKSLQYDPVFTQGVASPFCSLDYPRYWEANLRPVIHDPALLTKALHELFLLDHPVVINQYCEHDLGGLFSVLCCEENPDHFFGAFTIQISRLVLGEYLDLMAYNLAEFAKQCSLHLTNINAAVVLSSSADANDYEQYFYGTKRTESADFRCCDDLNLSHTFYLNNVGWTNIISPKTRKLENRLAGCSKTAVPGLDICELANGVLFLQCVSPISQTKQRDLYVVKKYIYGALFPGESSCPIDYYFRRLWENVPILDEEISVNNGSVFFSHGGQLNIEYVRDVMIRNL